MANHHIQAHAVQILSGVLIEKHNLNQVFSSVLADGAVQNISTIKEISYGVLRKYKTLDYWLSLYLSKPLVVQRVYLLLLVALYQLSYTNKPVHAVVNEAVNLVSKRYKGLVNALLRKHLRQTQDKLVVPESNLEAYYNLPAWWINTLQQEHPGHVSEILAAYQNHPPLTLRVNLRKTSVSDYMAVLEKAGIQAEHWAEHAVYVVKPVSVSQIPYFFEGYVSVQDFGAQQAVPLLNVSSGAYVLDACAAPGGKIGHLLEQVDCEVLALDISQDRLQKVADNLTRLGLSAELKCADASLPETWWDGRYFDYILADIPCTASGVVKRNPDIRWLRQPDDSGNMAKMYAKLLDNLWKCLKTKGRMLIATCSVFQAENQNQLANFLARNTNANLLSELQLLPDDKRDGFYYALVQKS